MLNQLDGFDYLGKTKVIFATNRVRSSHSFQQTAPLTSIVQPDTLDPALLRPGRVDRKIEIPLPNEVARMEILKIHAGPIRKTGEIGTFPSHSLFLLLLLIVRLQITRPSSSSARASTVPI